ncbi:MAG: glycosyltransferase family 2 protein [Synechococcus sp.]
MIGKLIASLPPESDCQYRMVVVNNSAGDRQLESLCSDTVTILNPQENLGFGRGCNFGLEWISKQNSDAIVWLINPDARLMPQVSLVALTDFIRQHNSIAILGTEIYTDTQDLWFGYGSFDPLHGTIQSIGISCTGARSLRTCDWVSGCSTILNLGCFDSCPKFDPSFFLYYEDFDFCQRYRSKGYTVAITDKFSVIHAPSSITNRNQFDKINHSTFSYLLVLERYAYPTARMWRFMRLLIIALFMLPFQPSVAFGKLYGVARYLSKSE